MAHVEARRPTTKPYTGKRYEIRPHTPSREYTYEGGWARWDKAEDRQVGWWSQNQRTRAEQETEEANNREYLEKIGAVKHG
jgi:hypothetical protein